MRTRIALAVIVATTLSFCQPLAAQGRSNTSRRFTLSGTVVDGSGQPMAGVELSLQTTHWKGVGEPLLSDGQGRFAFGGLTAGEYILSAEGGGFGTVHYGTEKDPGWVSSLAIEGDKSIVFRILPRGVVEGVIRDEFGDPMVRMPVSLAHPAWRAGRMSTSFVGQKFTDDRGRYRFGNLAPGNYMVCAAGSQNISAPISGPVDYATRVENRAYARTCNRTFPLSPGQRAQVDLTPLSTATVTVRGKVRDFPAQSGFSVYLQSEDEYQLSPQTYNAFIDATQASFTIGGVPPGHYRLRAQSYTNIGQAKPLMGELLLDVGGSDISGLEVALGPQTTVEVTVHGLADEKMNEVVAELGLSGAIGTIRGWSQRNDGVFQFQSVPAGSYRLNLRTPDETCVESVKLGDRQVMGAPFDLRAGAALHLDATVSQNCASLRIRTVREGAAVPAAKVVVLLSGTPRDPGQMLEDFTNDEGESFFGGLPPGKHLVWAWVVEGPGAITGPSTLAAVEGSATVVEVKAGEASKIDVPLLTDEGRDR